MVLQYDNGHICNGVEHMHDNWKQSGEDISRQELTVMPYGAHFGRCHISLYSMCLSRIHHHADVHILELNMCSKEWE